MTRVDHLEMPKEQAVRLEYPGYVQDIEAALFTLGDSVGLQLAASSANTHIRLKFRPRDGMCRPLVGEKCSVKGLLVEVCRKELDVSEPVTVKAVARVNGSYQFASLADFQFVADDSLNVQPNPPQSEANFMCPLPEPLLAVPPVFAKSEEAINYQFQSFYGADPPAFKAQGGGKLKGQLPPHVLKFVSLHVPPAVTDLDSVIVHHGAAKGAVISQLRTLFAERPVWNVLALRERLSSSKGPVDTDLLAKLAYVFRSGPFRSLWIRRGYDPRTDPQSCQYQGYSYASPLSEALSSRLVVNKPALGAPVLHSEVYSDLCRFAAVPAQGALLQLCDLQDSQVSALIAKAAASARACTRQTGWFDERDWRGLIARIEARFSALSSKSTPEKEFLPAQQQANLSSEAAHPSSIARESNGQAAEEHQIAAAKGDAALGQIVPQDVLSGLLADWSRQQATAAQEEDPADGIVASREEQQGDDDEFEIFEAGSDENESDQDEVGGEEDAEGAVDMYEDIDEDSDGEE